MKKLLAVLVITSMLLALSACGSGSDKAKTALEGYLQSIVDRDYEAAYEYLSDFDKDNISKEIFIQWRTDAAKVQSIKSFTISSKADRFKNYKYLGTAFGDAFGFEVGQDLEKTIAGIDLEGYDSDSYHILMVSDNEEWKVALLLTDLDEQVKSISKLIAEKEKAAQ